MKTVPIKKCRQCGKLFKPGGYNKHMREPCGIRINVKEACKMFKVERTTFWRKVKSNGINGKKIGREVTYSRLEIREIFKKRRFSNTEKIRLILKCDNFYASQIFNAKHIRKQEKW